MREQRVTAAALVEGGGGGAADRDAVPPAGGRLEVGGIVTMTLLAVLLQPMP